MSNYEASRPFRQLWPNNNASREGGFFAGIKCGVQSLLLFIVHMMNQKYHSGIKMPKYFVWMLLAASFVQSGLCEIISVDRRTTWQGNVGVQGGIPTRTTIYQTLNPGATAAQINSAIAACPTGQVVFLAAGTYNLTAPISLTKSNVTLRGAGPTLTKLVFSTYTGYDYIEMSGTGNYTPSPITNWTGGYTQGATSITVASASGFSVGDLVALDQTNDSAYIDTGDEGATALGNDSGGGHLQMQLTEITGISGTTITISPGLYMPNWTSGKSPRMMLYISGSKKLVNTGIEDLHFEGAYPSASAIYNINAAYTQNCWLENVEGQYGETGDVYSLPILRILNSGTVPFWQTMFSELEFTLS